MPRAILSEAPEIQKPLQSQDGELIAALKDVLCKSSPLSDLATASSSGSRLKPALLRNPPFSVTAPPEIRTRRHR